MADLLAAKRGGGTLGLYAALQNGHVNCIGHYVDCTAMLPQNAKKALYDALYGVTRTKKWFVFTKQNPEYLDLKTKHPNACNVYEQLLNKLRAQA
jgi:hypothetical protein